MTLLLIPILFFVVRLALDNTGPLPRQSDRSPRMRNVR